MLSGPVVGRSRHAQVVDLARQRVHEHERAEHLEYSAYTKAATADVATDVTADVLGEFEALVSDFLPDRQGERFAPHAFDGALTQIRTNGICIPVLFGHKQDAVDSVLGMVPGRRRIIWHDTEVRDVLLRAGEDRNAWDALVGTKVDVEGT